MKHFLEFKDSNGRTILIAAEDISYILAYTEKASLIQLSGVSAAIQVTVPYPDLKKQLVTGGWITLA